MSLEKGIVVVQCINMLPATLRRCYNSAAWLEVIIFPVTNCNWILFTAARGRVCCVARSGVSRTNYPCLGPDVSSTGCTGMDDDCCDGVYGNGVRLKTGTGGVPYLSLLLNDCLACAERIMILGRIVFTFS